MVTLREDDMSRPRTHSRRPRLHLRDSNRSLPSRAPKPERYPLSHVVVRAQ